MLKGHNGAVFDVAFDPTGRLLASASGDRTVKLWDVATGERLDTFSQPTKDQYAVAFSPDGQHVIAGGVDSRIRVWQISPSAKEGTNDVVESLFAHDGPIVRLAVSRDGRWIASSSEDRTIKIWDAARFTQVEKLADQSDWTTALAIAPDNRTLAAGRMDGSLSIQLVRWMDRGDDRHGDAPRLRKTAAGSTDPPSTKIATRAGESNPTTRRLIRWT